MVGHYTYLCVDIGCLLFPFLFSFYPKMPFYKNWKALFAGTLLMMGLFIPWDIFFTAKGIWGFNDNYILGLRLFGLPVEEWLFFICIPYACVFSYEAARYSIKKTSLQSISKGFGISIILICLLLVVFNIAHWYTVSACLLCATLIALHLFVWKSNFLGWFFGIWLVLLIPFFISNGVLTGLNFLQYPIINLHPENITDQIVWYNNMHNLGIRIWSVPLDDFFYGMLMFLLVVTGYEKTLNR